MTAQADQRWVVNTAVRYQTVKGFGASGCWWANNWNTAVAAGPYPAETVREAVRYLYHPQIGIGLTTYRHNVGGGTVFKPTDDQYHTACIETAPGCFDLSRDAAALQTLDWVVEQGATAVTLFMNSPPARLLKNGDTCGQNDGSGNLPPERFDDYVRYVVGVTRAFVQAGYPIVYVSPINEPQGTWGREGDGNGHYQEGCHYTPDEVLELTKRCARALRDAGLSVKVSAPETANWGYDDYTRGLYRRMRQDKELCGLIDHFCGHSYDTCPGDVREEKRKLAALREEPGPVLPIHQTEFAEIYGSGAELSIDAGLVVARSIYEDMTILQVPVWEFWTGVEHDTTWHGGLLYLRNDGRLDVSKKAWVMGQYARFVTGATRVELTGDDGIVSATAYERDDGTVVIVALNDDTAAHTAELTGVPPRATVYVTDAIRDLAEIGTAETAHVVLPPRSVTTLVCAR